MTSDQFKDRCIVVTGGASGIGEACVRRFASEGASVVVADVDTDRGRSLADVLSCNAIEIDVGSDTSIEAAVSEIESTIAPVDGLVTSAGILQRPLPPDELAVDEYDRVLNVDLRGTYLTCRAFGSRMVKRGSGSIVNIASVAGLRSMPLHAYSPAKAAVIATTECLAAEWGRTGVRVNTISPGFTLTPAMQKAIDRGERDPSALAENTAQGRLVNPDEIANAVAFLMSDEASAITGANLPVDAGWLVAGSWNTYGGVRPPK
jgi:NAD(P)-dependent dehydrogenase (short-subunit alcohol dehydrogenase family)